ncbi:MAG: hypothetical protein OEV91_10575, partial [Desulfobulbaceae bacterium]|nr:hypothetical protein [Desulfobulbaceae bacterium]
SRYVNAGFKHDGDTCRAVKPREEFSVSALDYGHRDYPFSVTGSGCGHDVYGVIKVDGFEGVSGVLYLENGSEVRFYGDWIGDGLAEGVDNNGNLYTVKVDR